MSEDDVAELPTQHEEHASDAHTGVSSAERATCADTERHDKRSHGHQRLKLHKWIHRPPAEPQSRPRKLGYTRRERLKAIAISRLAARPKRIRATSMLPGVSLPRLPQKLINYIISFLCHDPPTMQAWRLVSCACFSYVATFSGVLRVRSAGTLSMLSRSFARTRSREELRRVHTLELSNSTTPWVHRAPLLLGSALVNLTYLHLSKWSPASAELHPAILRAFARLRSVDMLVLERCHFESVAQLLRLLGAFPSIREFGMYGVYVPTECMSAERVSGMCCRPPLPMTCLVLSNSGGEKGEVNVAGALAGWFTQNRARVKNFRNLRLDIEHADLLEGELASIGALVTAVAPHILTLELDISESQSHVADWGDLRLDSCVNVHTLRVRQSCPGLHESVLLYPDCHIKTLILAGLVRIGHFVTLSPLMSSPRLPPEIIEHVISFLLGFPDMMAAWKLVSRACHAYVMTSSRVLTLHSAGALSTLSRSLPEAAGKLHRVETLLLCDSATPWLYRVPLLLGPALMNLTTLQLFKWSPAHASLHPAALRAFAYLRSVNNLCLIECRFRNVAQLQRLLCAFPRLRLLSLHGVYVPTHRVPAEFSSVVFCGPPQSLICLSLGNSFVGKSEKGEANVAAALLGWFGHSKAKLENLQKLFLLVRHANLQEGELANIGQLVALVAPHIRWLRLDFDNVQVQSRKYVPEWSNLKIDSCVNVQGLVLFKSSPKLHELGLLSPTCRIRAISFKRLPKEGKPSVTDWAALTVALDGSAFTKLMAVINGSRIPQNAAEVSARDAFIKYLNARRIQYVDKTELSFM